MPFQKIIGTNLGIIYAITITGELLWYRDLKQDGTNGAAAESGWHVNSGHQIGIGWENFRHVFSGGNGIIYAIKPSGELLWYQDLKQDGTNGSAAQSGWHVNSGSQIGIGWENFKHVFSGGNGIIYAIKPGGELLWYQDLIQDGTNGSFAERGWNVNSGKTIGTGWYSVSTGVFSGGNGVIYRISLESALVFYKDLKRNGETLWDRNSTLAIGIGWRMIIRNGFCWPFSASAGHDIKFFNSTASQTYTAAYVRFKNDDGVVDEQVIQEGNEILVTPVSPEFSVARKIQNESHTPVEGADDWHVSFYLTIPQDWPSGLYAAKCVDDDITFYVPFVVKATATQQNRLLVLMNTNTWNAYNPEFGYSRYAGAVPNEPTFELSFLRPNRTSFNPGEVDTNPNVGGEYGFTSKHQLRGELWIHSWLEQSGYAIDVVSDLDLHVGVDNMPNYEAVIITTHPEYWTLEMYKHLEAYLNQGGRLLYLGGNGIYDEVKISDDLKVMTAFGGVLSRTNLFSQNNLSEARLLGVATPSIKGIGNTLQADGNNFPERVGYEVDDPGISQDLHRFFLGTGLQVGSIFGEHGWYLATGYGIQTIDKSGASGGEVDKRHASSPQNIQVLATGQNQTLSANPPNKVCSEMTYYDHTGGGFVFSASSITFGGSLVIDETLKKIISNVLDECLGIVR